MTEVESLLAQVQGHERELARIEESAAVVGWLNDLVCQRAGLETVLMELHGRIVLLTMGTSGARH